MENSNKPTNDPAAGGGAEDPEFEDLLNDCTKDLDKKLNINEQANK
jgi:hypothetical protein